MQLETVNCHEVSFSDLEFAERLVLCQSSIGRQTREWIPCGMPALRQTITDSAFFLYRRNPLNPDEWIGPLGTGSVVSRASKVLDGEVHYYGVSNWHLTNRAGQEATSIRLNTRDGASRMIDLPPSAWKFENGGDDLSIADLTDHIDPKADEVSAIPESTFICRRVVTAYELGIGEDGFMFGMLTDNPGGKRNTPAGRFGNLSMLASEDELIKQPNSRRRPSHLMDFRSRTGFSGSPVFLYRIPDGDLTKVPERDLLSKHTWYARDNGIYSTKNWFLGLLGVHCGQFWEPGRAFKSKERAEQTLNVILDGEELHLQIGLTIVVPAWRITELMDMKNFEHMRNERDANRRSQWAKKPLSTAQSAGPTTTDENPQHREDFTALLGEAARKPRQGE